MHPLISKIKSRIKIEHVFIIIFLIAVLLRFCFLDLKLFHHDESIHAWFSYELLTKGEYIYDPVYHGPFLYYVTSSMFSLFGVSDLVGRILPCVFGCAIIPLIYWIYRMGYLNGKIAAVAALFVAVSPQMVYFSRFLRNDAFIIFFSLLMICAFLAWINRAKACKEKEVFVSFTKGNWAGTAFAALLGAAAAFGVCSKENMPIVVVTFAVFILYLLWSKKLVLPKSWIRDAAVAVIVFFGIVFTMYTSFWQYPEMVFNAGQMAISHWLEMHNTRRIDGPATFYLTLFILYELPILLLAVVGAVRFLIGKGLNLNRSKANEYANEANKEINEVANEANEVANEANEVVNETNEFANKTNEEMDECKSQEISEPEKKSILTFLKNIIRRPDITPINKEREFMRFAIYWLILSCITYAYLGEKVPWLSLHQLLPMVFVAAFGLFAFKKYWRVAVLVVSVVGLSLLMFNVAFTPSDIDGPIVQVQNSEELVGLMNEIDDAKHVAFVTDKLWPLRWYLRDTWDEKVSYYGRLIPESSLGNRYFDIIIAHDDESYDSLAGYDKRIQRHSYWFESLSTQREYGNPVLSWLRYYFTRDGVSGSYRYAVYTKNGT